MEWSSHLLDMAEKVSNSALCGKCRDCIGEKGMLCDECSGWFHCKCVDIAPALYKAISTSKCLGNKYFCGDCEDKVGKWLGGLGNMI